MKHSLFTVTFLALLLTQSLYAQDFNVNHEIPNVQTRVIDIVDDVNGGSCMLGSNVAGIFTEPIILRRLDNFGNIIGTPMLYTQPGLHPTKLLRTANDEFIVVGYIRKTIAGGSFTLQPFAARFDAGLNMVWMEEYAVNSLEIYTFNSSIDPIERVNIAYCADDSNMESYIITYPADQPYYTPP